MYSDDCQIPSIGFGAAGSNQLDAGSHAHPEKADSDADLEGKVSTASHLSSTLTIFRSIYSQDKINRSTDSYRLIHATCSSPSIVWVF